MLQKLAASLASLSSLRKGLLWRWCRPLMSKVSLSVFQVISPETYWLHLVFLVFSNHLCISQLLLEISKQVSGIYPFNGDNFYDEEFMGLTLQIDLLLPWLKQLPTVTVNAKRRRLILQDHQYLLQKKKHILLPQTTFDFLLKPGPERVRM